MSTVTISRRELVMVRDEVRGTIEVLDELARMRAPLSMALTRLNNALDADEEATPVRTPSSALLRATRLRDGE